MADVNAPRLERALVALSTSFDPDIELGDDEMPWATATRFRLDNQREADGAPIDGQIVEYWTISSEVDAVGSWSRR